MRASARPIWHASLGRKKAREIWFLCRQYTAREAGRWAWSTRWCLWNASRTSASGVGTDHDGTFTTGSAHDQDGPQCRILMARLASSNWLATAPCSTIAWTRRKRVARLSSRNANPISTSIPVCPDEPLSHRYRHSGVPFNEPAGTSRGVYRTRYEPFCPNHQRRSPGVVGKWECAPLPRLSCDDLPDYDEVLRRHCDDVCLSTVTSMPRLCGIIRRFSLAWRWLGGNCTLETALRCRARRFPVAKRAFPSTAWCGWVILKRCRGAWSRS